MPTLFNIFWPLWVVGGVIMELLALVLSSRKNPNLSLSDHFWAWFFIKDRSGKHQVLRWVGRATILMFTFWVGPHLAFAIWG